jgi:hypothetical protein
MSSIAVDCHPQSDRVIHSSGAQVHYLFTGQLLLRLDVGWTRLLCKCRFIKLSVLCDVVI